jgi:rare lipoprotein A
MSQPGTMVASAPPMTPRAAPEPVAEPVAVAAPRPAAVQVAQAPESIAVSELARPVSNAPRPPERPFDLATIPGAATPIAFAGAAPGSAQAARPAPQRATVAQLYYAAPQGPRQTFSKAHPLARDLLPQRFVALSDR